MASDVTPDGSPVPVYLALPVEPEFTPVLDFLAPPQSVLDLGCGVGRLANELAARGFDVTGVDESREMLEHLHPAVDAVHAKLQNLRLGRHFDTVVLASHFVNVAGDGPRQAFLRAAADHVAAAGTVLIEHWEMPPATPQEVDSEVAGVRVAFRVLSLRGNDLHGRVTYTMGDRSWTQTFRSRLLDEADLETELARAGLRAGQRLSPRWLAARPAG